MRQSLPNHSVTASWKSSRQRCVTRVAQRGSKVAIYSWMHLSLCRDQRSADGPNAISLFPSPALSWPNTTRHWRHEAQMCRLWERVVIMWLGVWKQHLLLCQLVHTHWKYGFISASVSLRFNAAMKLVLLHFFFEDIFSCTSIYRLKMA